MLNNPLFPDHSRYLARAGRRASSVNRVGKRSLPQQSFVGSVGYAQCRSRQPVEKGFLSFPGRRESRNARRNVDSRLRGNDATEKRIEATVRLGARDAVSTDGPA